MSSIRIDELTPTIGARVEGIDLSRDLDAETISRIGAILLKHRVIFFERQKLTPRQHRDFAAHFGTFEVHPTYQRHPECPEMAVLDTGPDNPTDNDNWHTDMTFRPVPPKTTMLYSRSVPNGGDTLWADTCAAFRALSATMREMLRPFEAVHDFSKRFPPDNPSVVAAGPSAYEDVKRRNPPVRHPVVRKHPETGEDCLFVNEAFTSRIVGLPQGESDAILRFLQSHIQKPEFSVRWRWSPDTLAVWDNCSTQHYAVNDYLPQRRVMHRITIAGEAAA